MSTKINAHGETTVLTKSAALDKAKHNARYRHGEWFVWMHKSGEWYCSNRRNVSVLEDAELNVCPNSKVYIIGEGYAGSFSRYGASIVSLWAGNARVGC